MGAPASLGVILYLSHTRDGRALSFGTLLGRHSVNLKNAVYACHTLLIETKTTLNNGYLGSRNDEERSEMRYLV